MDHKITDHGQMGILEIKETEAGAIATFFCDICGRTIQFGPEPGTMEVMHPGNRWALHRGGTLGLTVKGACVVTKKDGDDVSAIWN